jgi:hypothetical protein
MPDNNKIILGTNDDTYIAADDAGNIVLQHEGGNRISMNNTSITPASNEQIDLGSATKKFRDLYLSSDSIFIGNTKLSSDPTTGALSTVVADAQGQFTAAPSAVGGDVDFSNLSNTQETLLAKWRGADNSSIIPSPGDVANNPPTFQFENNGGSNITSSVIGHASGTVNGPGGIAIPYNLLQTRVRYGSGFTNIPGAANSVLKLTNKENIPSTEFMYDDANDFLIPGYSINPNFDHLKLVFYEEGSEGMPGFGGTPTYNYYWRVLDANGNDVNFWDGVNFFTYSPLSNLRFGHPSNSSSWGYQDGNSTGTLPANVPTWELYQSTNEVEIEESIKINGDPFSKDGLMIKDQAGNYRRITIDSVGNLGSTAV